jgi:hypothetical protein
LFHNSNVFGSCIIKILYTGCDKIKKKNNFGAKRLTEALRKALTGVPCCGALLEVTPRDLRVMLSVIRTELGPKSTRNFGVLCVLGVPVAVVPSKALSMPLYPPYLEAVVIFGVRM